MSKAKGKIGHWGGSGLRPRIALAMKRGKINALRLFYHILSMPAMQDFPIDLARLNPAEKQRDSIQSRSSAF
ncbi:hypothetical protein [Anaerotruncus colihominis]|uniref:hypothetical protein n=1 Tax=Anaerotruncus colihominis TaxID=169435 RepID=UPI0026EAC0D5|nr:hypothetical protein [Anaerotruncus colihominis]